MKIFYLAILSLFIGFESGAQQYWPHGSTPYPKCNTMPTNCTKVAVGGDWDKANSWSPAGVPTQDQVVCIPAGVTINVKGNTYAESNVCPATNSTNSPRLQIFICGTINFDPSGKLFLACFSFIQVYSGGKIVAATGSSDLIQIGTNIVWGGPSSGTQPDINGPWVVSYPFTGAGVLTVGFDYFKVNQKQPYQVQLDWGTSHEVNSDAFIIERSTDQKNWSNIGSVKTAGNSSAKQAYSFTDKAPVSGTAYYRLKQVDNKADATYSEIIRFSTVINKNFSLFPNPVTSTTQLYAKEGFTAGQTILILDAKGMIVKKINPAGTNRQQLDLTTLAKGLYLIQIVDQTRVIEKISLIKQ